MIKKGKKIIFVTRVLPVVVFFLMLAHVALLTLGLNLFISEVAEVCAGFYIVYALSDALGFCRIHKLMIYYAYAVTVCVWFERYAGFDEFLFPARVSMLSIGLIILSIFIYDRTRRTKGTTCTP